MGILKRDSFTRITGLTDEACYQEYLERARPLTPSERINLERKIMLESKLVCSENKEEWKSGYFLSIDELKKLVRDFQVDCHDGFVSNDTLYIENWLKNHGL